MASVIFLGTSSAVPSIQRGFSCIGVREDQELILMDCGDGAIRNLLRFNVDLRTISSILITHYHSDHLSGLTQIVETMGMRRRTEDLNVYGPPGLKDYFAIVQKTTNVAFNKTFRINLNEITSGRQFSTRNQQVRTFMMDHTIPCLGYRLESNGKVIAFTGDTQPCISIKELGQSSDLFIHEATFLQSEIDQARPSKHSTPKEAAEAAALSQSGKLILTHVNDDHEKPEDMMREASEVFQNVSIAYDGLTVYL